MKNEKTISLIDRFVVIGPDHEELSRQANNGKHTTHNIKILEDYKSSNLKESHNENYTDNIPSVTYLNPVLFPRWNNLFGNQR
jgi:hypothetical protein